MPTTRAGIEYVDENDAANADPVNAALDDIDEAFTLVSETEAHTADADAHHDEVHVIGGPAHTGSITAGQHGTIASGNLHPEYATDTDLTNHGANANAHHTQEHDINGSDHTGTPLTLAKGGTSKALSASAGGIVYTDADSMEVLSGTATAGRMLRSGGGAAPAWSASTYPNSAGPAGRVPRSDGTNYVDAQLAHGDLSGAGSNSHSTIDSHLAATAAHGATGAVVGTTNTQTLSGKTLTAPTLNSPVINGPTVKRTHVANANYTVTDDDYLVTFNTGATNRNCNLPPVTEGRIIHIAKIDGGVGSLTIEPNGSETVNGLPSLAWNTQYLGYTLIGLQAAGMWLTVASPGF